MLLIYEIILFLLLSMQHIFYQYCIYRGPLNTNMMWSRCIVDVRARVWMCVRVCVCECVRAYLCVSVGVCVGVFVSVSTCTLVYVRFILGE